jgi:glycosyltransferase involved in cell wall biosynthesis
MRLGVDASNIRSGGGITHLISLLGAARPLDHGISTVFVWAGSETLKKLPSKSWLKGIYVPLLDAPLPLRLYWQNTKLAKLATHSCDILFAPGGTYGGSFRPFISMSQNLLPFDPTEMARYGTSWMAVKFLLLRRYQKSTFDRADGVIFLNEYARSKVVQAMNGLNGKSAIIPHGINMSFRLPPRSPRPIDGYSQDNPFKLLYVSIIDVYKHQWNIAQAVADLRHQGIPVELDLVGPAYPPALRRLRKILARLDPRQDFIHYLGPIPYDDLPSYYHRADLFVFGSTCENMPIILLEAMASGLPIACSGRGPMPDILTDGGVYFDPEDSEDVARALLSLIEAPALRANCARLAFQRTLSYSWERCAQETLAFATDVAATTRSHYQKDTATV